ncbi:MAG: hypothetical protein ABR555_08845 [Pyrinomonadaceae bacterium]
MKLARRKQRQPLSILTPRSFGKSAMNPDVHQSPFATPGNKALAVRVLASRPVLVDTNKLRTVLLEDLLRVERATVRESETHRFWPRYVLDKFNRADVITESKTSHYVVVDDSLKKH